MRLNSHGKFSRSIAGVNVLRMLPNVTATRLPLAVAIVCCLVALVASAANDDFNIELKQKDAEVYHEQSFGRNEFNYGYQVEKTNSQFQHKAKGPDDVTYGCYGYIDPDGEKHLVYYIADRLGYRLLAPDQPTKVFTDRVANSVNKLDAELQGRKLDEKVVAWNDLYLPATCRRLNEIISITLPPTPAVVQTTTARNGAGAVTPIQGPAEGNGNGFFNGGQNEPNLGNGNSGADKVQAPIVNESNQGGLKRESEVRTPSTELPRENSQNGLGVSERPDSGTGAGANSGGNDGANGGGHLEGEDISRNENVGVPQGTTQAPVRQEVYKPATPEPTPAPQQIDPIELLPETTYVPIVPTTTPYPPSRVTESHPPNCGHQAPGGPFTPGTKYPATVGQFNGFVFPINRDCDASGRSTADLLAQMQAINELVLKVSSTLHALTGAPAARNATCERVLELLNIQQPVPLLVYVPIMIPYLDGGIHGAGSSSAGAQRPPINPASYAYAKSCSECK
uniref:Uncharacterized protein n=1 Tax=Anopheles atroparvus TaxID=41427 RepID=A0AAG5DKT9_ANOAO